MVIKFRLILSALRGFDDIIISTRSWSAKLALFMLTFVIRLSSLVRNRSKMLLFNSENILV